MWTPPTPLRPPLPVSDWVPPPPPSTAPHRLHAGNFPALVKHALVLWLLERRQAAGPVTVIDTHAGAGVYDRDPGSWEIGWIAVHPEHRRRGLGEAVTRLALDRALNLGPRTILLYTEDHRLDALRLYLRLGFRPALRHRSHRRRWRSVADRLPSEAAAQFVSSLQAQIVRAHV